MSVCILYISLDGPCVESCRCRLLPCPGWRLRSRDGVSMYACAHVHICLPTLPLQYPVSSEKITCTCRFKTSKKLYMHMCIYIYICVCVVVTSEIQNIMKHPLQTRKRWKVCHSAPVSNARSLWSPTIFFAGSEAFPDHRGQKPKAAGRYSGQRPRKHVCICVFHMCVHKKMYMYMYKYTYTYVYIYQFLLYTVNNIDWIITYILLFHGNTDWSYLCRFTPSEWTLRGNWSATILPGFQKTASPHLYLPR